MTDKIDEAALRCQYSCGLPHNDNQPKDQLQIMDEMFEKIFDAFGYPKRPVHTNPATYEAKGEDL